MSRLYLTILFTGVTFSLIAQQNLKKYLDFAEEKFNQGDYHYAMKFYEKAMRLDSNSIDILWKYAETCRAYKDYRKAEYYYKKVYNREEARIYNSSLLKIALMQKHNGKYEKSLETFKRAKKKYNKSKKSYNYQKAKKEIESITWIKSTIFDTSNTTIEKLPKTINTNNSEFGHTIYDNQLFFSSLRGDSISDTEEVYTEEYKTSLYTSDINNDSFQESQRLKELLFQKYNTGNGTFSLDKKRFYFSKCREKNSRYICKIMVAKYSNNKWSNIDSLGEIINEPEVSTTMPSIGKINGEEVLFFASNRKDSKGGLDIYYSTIKNGNQYKKAIPLKEINTIEDDVTPWWDSIEQKLYFSSKWHNGFGGFDVHYSKYTDKWEAPINAGKPVNSSNNDLYYFKLDDKSFITSNRIGVFYSKNPTCCSDIFIIKNKKDTAKKIDETLIELNKRLPVVLYFHNDEPNPKSKDTLTEINYLSTYIRYNNMLSEYQNEYSKDLTDIKAKEAKMKIKSFFIDKVKKGISDLELFRDLLLKELSLGARINITIKGFASPLAKTNYNVNLTKRRISSLINYIREYDNGVFIPYLDGTAKNGGEIIFSQIPFGEYNANQETSDNPNDIKNSIYSISAAKERRIEIQSVNYIKDETKFALTTKTPIINIGKLNKGEIIKKEVIIKNRSLETININNIRTNCNCLIASIDKSSLDSNENGKITFTLDTKNLNGFNVKSITVQEKNSKENLTIYISTEIE
ncbi:MAG: hypothetical protein CL844_00615 [Crocinitomicaceae bacterium]|nr:hypothetical protein [Crocinitomicaceae bacterium]|tara:strand:+ start:35687 stop:37921 length:2235 start_codon:yes stop_codon:yes gene_type:complete